PRNKAPSDLPANGTWGILKASQLAKSANYELVRTGHAYATLYTSMPREQRAEFRVAAMGARGDGLGLWKQDVTESFFFGELADVEVGGHLVLPKLFRRLVDYSKSLAQGFDGPLEAWLRERASGPRPEDDRVVLNDHVDNVDSIETSLSEILETINGRVTLKTDVNHLVFVEK
ncbi:MAG: hypothetical protein K0S65_3594, partial [Labilithrix sp.]|nr:hypothetical protein [Labilithrix sp.]